MERKEKQCAYFLNIISENFLSYNDYHYNLVDSFADRLKKERFPS